MKNATTNRVVDIKAENIIAEACAVGTYFYVDGFGHADYALVRIEMGYCSPDDAWESVDYYLIDRHTGEAHFVATDNGEGGMYWQMQQDEIAALIGDIDLAEYVQFGSFEEDWIEEAKKDAVQEVDDDYAGECNIFVTHNYADGASHAKKDTYLRDREDVEFPAVFENAAAAMDWINQSKRETYYLDELEERRPTYTIVEA